MHIHTSQKRYHGTLIAQAQALQLSPQSQLSNEVEPGMAEMGHLSPILPEEVFNTPPQAGPGSALGHSSSSEAKMQRYAGMPYILTLMHLHCNAM